MSGLLLGAALTGATCLAESLSLCDYPRVLPRSLDLLAYSPRLCLDYGGLQNTTYVLKVWLLTPPTFNCGSDQWCERVFNIDNSNGAKPAGRLTLVQPMNVFDSAQFLWVARLYLNESEVAFDDTGAARGTANRPPVLDFIGPQTAVVEQPLTFQLQATDPNGDDITYRLDEGPPGATLDPVQGRFRWFPPAPGLFACVLTAVDTGDGQLTDSELIQIVVTNTPPPELVLPRPLAGVGYGPFREGQSPTGTYPTTNQLLADLTLLQSITPAVRTYGTSNTLFYIPQFCARLGLDCYVGAEISPRLADTGAHEWELSNLVTIAAQNYPTTKALVVGNETLFHNPNMLGLLTGYVARIKSATTQPVTHAEPWNIWDRDEFAPLAEAVDLLMVHVHPFWEGPQLNPPVPLAGAAQLVLQRYLQIKAKYPNKPVVLGETGWPTDGPANGVAQPGLDEQKRFLAEVVSLLTEQQIDYFYFTAFDEPFKTEGGVGPHWGLFDVNRRLKLGLAERLRQFTRLDFSRGHRLGLQTYPGNHYRIESSPRLPANRWSSLTNFAGFPGTNRSEVLLPSSTNSSEFYRALMMLSPDRQP